jgi:ribonuclease-3
MRNINELFKIINVHPKNVEIYELALTHSSFNADANTKHIDNERLEYMGDAVLDYVSADLIFNEFGEMEPGNMSKLRSFLVKTHSLSNYARKIELADFIKTGHSISQSQVNQSDKILEDCFEALVGAIYIDQGIEFTFNFIKNIIRDDLLTFGQEDLTDYKSMLQEEMQAEHRESVHYVVVSEHGPAHDRTFVVNVLFNDIVLASGSGKSKKIAEQEAAKNALKKRSV